MDVAKTKRMSLK